MKLQFTTKQFIDQVQRDLLISMVMSLRHGKISEDRAQQLARDFMEVKKSDTLEDFVQELSKLIPDYPEAHEVYIKHAPAFYETMTKNKLSHMREYFEVAEYGKAVKVAQAKKKIKGRKEDK